MVQSHASYENDGPLHTQGCLVCVCMRGFGGWGGSAFALFGSAGQPALACPGAGVEEASMIYR